MPLNQLLVSWFVENNTLKATLSLDRIPFYPEHHIDFMELAYSCRQPGEYEILTCSCGCMPCAGIWEGILVSYEDNQIVWRIRQPLVLDFDDERDEDEFTYDEYRFLKNEYTEAILAAVAAARVMVQQSSVPLRTISWRKIDALLNFTL